MLSGMGDSTLTTDLGRVLVTGGSGFVGANLVAELLARGHEVRSFDRAPSPLPDHPALHVIEGDICDKDTVATAVDGIDGLSVLTAPDSTLVALVADGSCDVFTIADEMLERGWFVQPQLSFRGVPPTLHLTLSAATAPSVPALVVALRESAEAARAAGPVALDPGLAGLLGSVDPATLDDAGFAGLLTAAGLAGSDGTLALPTRMATVNALLDACPPPLREALLLGVLDRLSRPTPG